MCGKERPCRVPLIKVNATIKRGQSRRKLIAYHGHTLVKAIYVIRLISSSYLDEVDAPQQINICSL